MSLFLSQSTEEQAVQEKYRAITLNNFRDLPQLSKLTERQKFAIDVVGRVLPFKTNNYVVNELIDWNEVPNDPLFTLTFPQEEMLESEHFSRIASLIEKDATAKEIKEEANNIRLMLNPHPAGQLEHNVPEINDTSLEGMQHKYKETVLFFPSSGQTCHAYCTFCFRWPQFVGMDELKFAAKQTKELTTYVEQHSEVTDILITGGDPLVMKTRKLASYVEPILESTRNNIKTIRIGTKALGYWPYRFTTDEDAEDLLNLFRKIVSSGRHLSIMAHFNHPAELETDAVKQAIEAIRTTGALIRTQSPLMRNINDSASTWSEMWRSQVQLGLIPYYMFVARDTGAKHFFEIPLTQAYEIFRTAFSQVSGLARTVRGPSMSADPGKVAVLGTPEIHGQKVIALQFLQARNPDWVMRPFYAAFDEQATWLDELRPAFGESRFFFETD